MKKQQKPAVKKEKKPYNAPKLSTHGDVAKLTKHHHHHKCGSPGSNLFDLPDHRG